MGLVVVLDGTLLPSHGPIKGVESDINLVASRGVPGDISHDIVIIINIDILIDSPSLLLFLNPFHPPPSRKSHSDVTQFNCVSIL